MEYELVNRPHQHPLFEKLEFKEDPVVECIRCRLPLHPPAYICSDSDSDCNFHIHQSCLHLPYYIKDHPFHSQHPLILCRRLSADFCSACGRSSLLHAGYECSQCTFQLDIKCAVVNQESTKDSGFWMSDKYVHFTHPHPLTFSLSLKQQRIIKKAICVICDLLIESGSSAYFCSQSQCEDKDIQFHRQCAELRRILENPDYHPHPLVLLFFRTSTKSSSSSNNMCNSCRNTTEGWGYSCLLCKFFLHISCMKSFNHIHTFTNMLRNKIGFKCAVCGQKDDNKFPWCCNECHTLVHKKCSEFPSTLMTNAHGDHVLNFNYFFPLDTSKIFCQICGVAVDRNYAGYACSTCDKFTAHLKCCAETQTHDYDQYASSPAPNNSATNENRGVVNCNNYLVLPAKLPRTIKPLFRLHPHPLTLISIPDFVFHCEACFEYFNGPAYHCEICFSILDVRCASLKHPFEHPNHSHSLYLWECNSHDYSYYCHGCGKKIEKKQLVFRCSKCDIYLDIGCATLPVEVRYRMDEHDLKLKYEEEEERRREYYCDICEEERRGGKWFYGCGECRYEAHPRCVLGEFPHVKSGVHKSHKHPLTLEILKLEKEENRGASFKLAFRCGVCNFTLDVKEEDNLEFVDQNGFSRAIQLYDYDTTTITSMTL